MGKEMTRERLDGVGFPTHQISYRLLTRQKVASSDGLRPFRNMKSYHMYYVPPNLHLRLCPFPIRIRIINSS